ncbi:MAG: DUF3365 domain-containing protein [Filomicrobium sp.]
MAKLHRLAVTAVITSLAVTAPALAEDTKTTAQATTDTTLQSLSKEAKLAIKGFAGNLKKELVGAMKSGGPQKALEVCKTVAPSIAASHSETTKLQIARTALKVRNPDNAPDDYERKVLEQFIADIAAGKDAKKLHKAEIVEQDGAKVFRFTKAIPTMQVCLRCHGSNIDPQLKSKIDELYPKDQATGFKEGELRGIFTISKKL